MDILLDQIEARVLGSLMEKELATPEYYPLSLNGLINACNQKSSRLPVMSLNETEVAGALQSLREKQLVFPSEAGRVTRYLHNFDKKHNLIRRESALLCTLLLRGPQTAGELRGRTERLCSFASLEEVTSALDSLAAIGLVARLPRQPGRKEQRYAHLLAGVPEETDSAAPGEPAATTARGGEDRLAELARTVAVLQEELEALKQEFSQFRKEFQ